MKKLFVTMVIAFMAIGVNAQTTYNIRVGGGFGNLFNVFYSHQRTDVFGTFAFQTNIPFQKTSKVVFSPSISVLTDFTNFSLDIPLQVGYKIPLAKQVIFIPKLGCAVGYRTYEDEEWKGDYNDEIGIWENDFIGYYKRKDFSVNPSIELAFEIQHFIVALTGYGNLDERNACYLTLGYKF